MTLDIQLYKASTTLMSPLLPFYLKKRVKNKKEDPARLGERFGKTQIARPAGELIWMHGASVGESLMLLPLIDKIAQEFPDTHVLITTGTLTSAQLIAKHLPANCTHQFAPADSKKSVCRFLDHWKPDLAIWAESEIWPNLILETRKREIPTALLNARFSEKSLAGWKKRAKSAKVLIGGFDAILAADQPTADGLSKLIDREVELGGNLKHAAPPLEVNKKDLRALRSATKGRPIWAAASTHHGEDGLIVLANKDIKAAKPDSLLVLAPRHPERAGVMRSTFVDAGYTVAQRSKEEPITPETDIYLFDTLGELGLVYSLAPVSCVAGSLAPGLSGHNPLEPARLKSAIVSGVNVSSFADVYDALIALKGVQMVADTVSFPRAILELLDDDKLRRAQIRAASKFVSSQDDVLKTVWDVMAPLMPANR